MTGSLSIASNVPGASVRIDGQSAGVTDAEGAFSSATIPVGEHRVEVASSGYETWSGTVTVDGTGSSWANSGSLVVGNSDTGTLTIRNGGAVSNTNADIGNFPDGTGTVTVDGAGSSWTNTGLLTVGDQGRGVLTVSNGAAVSSTGGVIGGFTGSTGTVTVDGTGSSWANAGMLVVGIRRRWTETVNLGAAFFAVLLLLRYVDWWWDVMPKYVFFLIVGITAIGLMVLLQRLRRSARAAS